MPPTPSRYQSLEQEIVDRLVSQVSNLKQVIAAGNALTVSLTTTPSAIVVWNGTKTIEVSSIAGYVWERQRVNIMVLLVTVISQDGASGDERTADEGAYEIVDLARRALIGFVPTVVGCRTVWPIVSGDEEYFELSGGLVGIALELAVEWKFTQGD